MDKKKERFLVGISLLLGMVLVFLAAAFWVLDGFYTNSSDALHRVLTFFIPGILLWCMFLHISCIILECLGDRLPRSVKEAKEIIFVVGLGIIGYYVFVDKWTSPRLGIITKVISDVLSKLVEPVGFIVSVLLPLAIGVVLVILAILAYKQTKKK